MRLAVAPHLKYMESKSNPRDGANGQLKRPLRERSGGLEEGLQRKEQ